MTLCRNRSIATVAHTTLIVLAATLCGCGLFRSRAADPEFSNVENGPNGGLISNPLFIPGGEREFVWNQIIDEIDNYFTIQREARIQVVGGVLTEGTIETRFKTGSTYLEPWRIDSSPGYEKLHATLQSIRRSARARLIPVENGYMLNVIVHKELEDVDKPVQASAGAMIQRHDSSLVREQVPPGTFSITPGWISQGRDVTLEQQILANLKSRLCDLNTPFKEPAQGTFTDF